MQGDGLMEANCVGFIDRKVAPLIAVSPDCNNYNYSYHSLNPYYVPDVLVVVIYNPHFSSKEIEAFGTDTTHPALYILPLDFLIFLMARRFLSISI